MPKGNYTGHQGKHPKRRPTHKGKNKLPFTLSKLEKAGGKMVKLLIKAWVTRETRRVALVDKKKK